MPVPSLRFLWALLALVPFTLLGAVVPISGHAAAIGLPAILLVGVLDLWWSRKVLEGLVVPQEEMVRMPRGEATPISLSLRCPQVPVGLRIGLPLPASIEAEESTVRLPPKGTNHLYRLTWKACPAVRGRFAIPLLHLGARSRWGLWEMRARIAARLEIRVYPNLRRERKAHAALFLPHGAVGLRRVRQMGKGREFEKLREYAPGDPYEDIHWKATARRGSPITKTYQVERTQEVYVVVDTSRLSAREIRVSEEDESTEQVIERYLSAALLLGVAAEQQGDHFGMVTFGQQVGRFIPAGGGGHHFNACREAIHQVGIDPVNPDYEGLFTFLRNRIRKRALILVLTSLDDPALADQFLRGVDLVCRKHLVVVHPLAAPGVEPAFTEAGESPTSLRDIYRRLEGHLTWERVREVRREAVQRGVHWAPLTAEQMTVQLINQYLEIKERQLL